MLGLPRSGTTLVQRVLNCHPQITIWGEHDGALRSLLDDRENPAPYAGLSDGARTDIDNGYAKRASVIGALDDPSAFEPWVSPFNAAQLDAAMQHLTTAGITELFTRDLPEEVRWGFKETRYAGSVVRGLATAYPEAHFVLVTRAFLPWASSLVRAPWRRDVTPSEVRTAVEPPEGLLALRKMWNQRTRVWLEFIDVAPERRMLVSQETLASPGVVRQLFERVEMAAPPTPVVDTVLAARAGSSDASTSWTADDRSHLERLLAGLDGDVPRHLRDRVIETRIS